MYRNIKSENSSTNTGSFNRSGRLAAKCWYELRRFVAASFTSEALAEYMPTINRYCAADLATTKQQSISLLNVFPKTKKLTLAIAAQIFAGVNFASEQNKMQNALNDILNMSNARLAFPIPGTIYQRGKNARQYLEKYFNDFIPQRRNSTQTDLFSRLCAVENDRGERLSDSEIVDNVIGSLIAGHDTSTVALTTIIYELAKSPTLQEQLFQYCDEIYSNGRSECLAYDDHLQLHSVDALIKEALRR